MRDPFEVVARMEEQEQRRYARSREGKARRARQGIEELFGGKDMAKALRSEPMTAEPLFSSAHAALVFALNYGHQHYDRPLMNRLAGGPVPLGKGLSGIDGAAQAGMIRGLIGQLSDHECALLVAYCSPKQVPIPGNHGDKIVIENKAVRVQRWSMNPEYQHAVHEVANSRTIQMLTASDFTTKRGIRVACVARCFGDKINLQDAAEACKVSYPTMKRMHRGVRDYLLGTNGADGQSATLGAIQQAMNRAEGLFRESGVID